MNLFVKLSILLFCVSPFLEAESVFHEIQKTGYTEFWNTGIRAEEYTQIYRLFDQVIDLSERDEVFEGVFQAKHFCFDRSQLSFFNNIPLGYKDRRFEEGKDLKSYFQYHPKFYDELLKNCSFAAQEYPLFISFLDALSHIHKRAQNAFSKTLEHMIRKDPTNLQENISEKTSTLFTLLKINVYYPSESMCTQPHYDKSALTLVLNNDDNPNRRFIISNYTCPFDFESLKIPNRRLDNQDSALLFPGLLFSHLNLSFHLSPSPHAVSSTDKVRHSIVAFAIPRFSDLSSLNVHPSTNSKLCY